MKFKFLKLYVLIGCLLAGGAFAKDFVTSLRNVNSSANISSAAWTQVVSSLTDKVTAIDVYNSSTSGTLQLGVGASGSETRYLYIQAGEARLVPINIARGARVSLKGVDATVSTGDIQLNFLGRD